MLPDRPVVSVVVPMLDERGYIEDCLEGFERQTYPLDRLEVLVVDGGSTDGSRELVEKLAAERPWIRIVDNPARRASAAFNRGMEAATGQVLCLFSAHGVPDESYVERSVDVLRDTGAAGVGGRYLHVGRDPVSNAVGLAMVSPVGMASPHRFASRRQDVDTISHPAYVLDAMRRVGPFDESLLRNSDYEFNWRMREAGYRLVFDPGVSSVYRPRGSLKALGRQFWWYGRWKARVIRRHPGSLKARHLAPPAATLVAGLSPVLLSSRSGRRAGLVLGLGYALLVALGVARAQPGRHGADPTTLAAAFPVMHLSWGAGFLASVVEDLAKDRARG